jgi:hypothetical protein
VGEKHPWAMHGESREERLGIAQTGYSAGAASTGAGGALRTQPR